MKQQTASNISKNIAMVAVGSAHSMYQTLATARLPFLNMGQYIASLTLPYICPPSEGNTLMTGRLKFKDTLYAPRNGIGAMGVKNLSSKIVLSLWPASVPFFKLSINEAILTEADALEEEVGEGEQTDEAGNITQVAGSFRSEIQRKLLGMEKTIATQADRKAHRKVLYEAMKKLLITGNVLLRWLPDGKIRTHNLGNYVVERAYDGTPYRIILKEEKLLDLLDEELRQRILLVQPELLGKPDAKADLYTYWGVQTVGTMWETWQEVGKGVVVPDSYGTYKKEDVPVSAQRLVAIDDEDYGCGLGEEHIADLTDLEQLEVNVKEIARAISKIIPLIDPNGLTELKDIVAAENLEFCAGRADDISVVTLLDKVNDYQAANTQIAEIKARLEQVFLMYTSVQRDAERVTAEEIRYIANELEKAHGGLYTVLADELQKPYVEYMINQAIKNGDLPSELFDGGDIRPEVVTGLDAIGRGQDVEALGELIGLIRDVPALEAEFNLAEVATRYLVAKGLELGGLLKTPTQKLTEQQAAQGQQKAAMADNMEADMLMKQHDASLEQPPVQ